MIWEPASSQRGRKLVTGLSMVWLCMLVVLWIVILWMAPVYETSFRNLGIQMPGVTEGAIDIARLIQDFWYIALVLSLGPIALVWYRMRIPLVIWVLLAVAAVMAAGLMILSLALPFAPEAGGLHGRNNG